jgi:hypothetical protein
MNFIDQLPSHLRSAAYRAGNEYAWKRSEATEVIDLLSQKGIALDGVEIWLATTPGPTIPTPYIYTWSARSRSQEQDVGEYVIRTNREARDYVATFKWDDQDETNRMLEPHFNLSADC